MKTQVHGAVKVNIKKDCRELKEIQNKKQKKKSNGFCSNLEH